MYLEQIKELADWDYCKCEQIEDDEAFYQFGWKGGLHFYLSEYFFMESSKRWLLNVWKNKKYVFSPTILEFDEVLFEIRNLINNCNE